MTDRDKDPVELLFDSHPHKEVIPMMDALETDMTITYTTDDGIEHTQTIQEIFEEMKVYIERLKEEGKI